MTTIRNAGLLGGRTLARNTVWSFIGIAAPLPLALFAIPLLIDGLGKDRFGLLTIIWMGIGYFSLFDMGLSRALTKMAAELLMKSERRELGKLIWTVIWVVLFLSALGMIVLVVCAGWIVGCILKVPGEIFNEGIKAFQILALGIPIVILSAALVGLLQAHQRFNVIAWVRVPLGAVMFIGPLAIIQFTSNLVAVTAVLVAVRFVALICYFKLTSKAFAELLCPVKIEPKILKNLLTFGGWLTVTNIIGPLLTYFDRLFIGSLLTMVAVTYYVTPYEVLSRFGIIPISVMAVMYPAFTAAFTVDKKNLLRLYKQSCKGILLLIIPPFLAIFLFAPEGLAFWLGDEFSKSASLATKLLCFGFTINAVALVPHTTLQSIGRPDIPAKLHLAELLPYIVLLWAGTVKYGIVGTAAVWTLRVFVDTIFHLWFVGKVVDGLKVNTQKTILYSNIAAGVFVALLFVEPLILRMLIAIVVFIICGFMFWANFRHLAAIRM